ncbi:amidase family protein [Acinetobacter haemolyticus]|uniref:amidase family protein n=1 Tax=Acinetobacter haemolyticus TaxID=29430 RepID=UPI003F55D75B
MSKDIIYNDATNLSQLIRDEKLSSRDLLEAHIQQIEKFDKHINSCIAFDYDNARVLADQADLAVKDQRPLGRLHGIPMTIKDAFKVKGMPCTDGNPEFQHYFPNRNAVSVDKLVSAGVIPFAKTNVPFKCADIQTYNQFYGTSNNPWNLALTTGGSSGGSAAALASGFTSIELGSDIGGSIRTPSHFCGVYGHKSTYGIVDFNGHILNSEDELSQPDLAVIGPMARSARDLSLMLDILIEPDTDEFRVFHLKESEKKTIQEFKVLFWMDDESCPIDFRIKKKYEELLEILKKANVKVDVGRPKNWDFDKIYGSYASRLISQMTFADSKLSRLCMSLSTPLVKLLNGASGVPPLLHNFTQGANLSHAQWIAKYEDSLQIKQECLKIFSEYDVILCPPIMTLAFEHDHKEPLLFRTLSVNQQKRYYLELFKWISPATVMGLPATSAPIGLSEDSLPVNIQIMAQPYADKVTIKFAELLAKYTDGFQRPSLDFKD